PGFFHCLLRVWNIARNTGAKIDFYATVSTTKILKRIMKRVAIEANFNEINTWKEVENVIDELEDNQGVVIFMAKRGMASYVAQMNHSLAIRNCGFLKRNYLLIYRYQGNDDEYQGTR